MEDVTVKIDDIYIPAKRRREIDPRLVSSLAESILEKGLQVPIGVRRDEKRLVLVSGLHRLEACKALGEETITAVIVRARQH